MNTNEWYKDAVKQLKTADIGTPQLDCQVLLEDATGKDRGWLLAHKDIELNDRQIKQLSGWLNRRLTHEPLAYIRNTTEFYGRQFYIDHRVLEPRPESEDMIELLAKVLHLSPAQTIIDVGTGSGALAITAKLNHPQSRVIVTDIDAGCLAVARLNARRLHASISCRLGNLLTCLTVKELNGSIILANLPYVPANFQINPAAMREPAQAIFGGVDGLEVYRKLFKQAGSLAAPPKYILTECLPPQQAKLISIAQANLYRAVMTQDFVIVFEKSNRQH